MTEDIRCVNAQKNMIVDSITGPKILSAGVSLLILLFKYKTNHLWWSALYSIFELDKIAVPHQSVHIG